jgi:hypothetical protein
MLMQGFHLIEDFQRDPDGEMVTWFELSYWLYRHTAVSDLDRQVFEVLRQVEQNRKMRLKIGSYLQTEGREHHRRIMRHRAGVLVPGLRTN